MHQIKAEIANYREINKGTLKAFFAIIFSPYGQKILDCKYFVSGDSRWFTFPQKEIPSKDGGKSEYIPIVSYADKEYLEELKGVILQQLKTAKPQEKYGQAKNPTNYQPQNKIQTDSPFDPHGLPF